MHQRANRVGDAERDQEKAEHPATVGLRGAQLDQGGQPGQHAQVHQADQEQRERTLPRRARRAVTDQHHREQHQAAREYPAAAEPGGQRGQAERTEHRTGPLGRGQQRRALRHRPRATVGQVVGHHRDQRDERRREERHQRDRADGGPARRLGPGRRVAGAQRRQQAGWLAPGRGQPDEPERQHHGQERDRVGHERDRIAERRHRRTGQRRPDDTAQVELGRVERDGGQELGLRHQVGEDGLLKRADQRTGCALHGDQRDQRGWAGPARRHQHGQQDRGPGRGQVAEDEDRPPGQPVGQRAADRRQQANRQEPADRHQHGPGGLAGVRDDQRTDRDRLHPRPDRGDQARRPQQGERPVPERLHAGQSAGLPARTGRAWTGRAGLLGLSRAGQFIRGPAHPDNLPAHADSQAHRTPSDLPGAHQSGLDAGTAQLTCRTPFCRWVPVTSGTSQRAGARPRRAPGGPVSPAPFRRRRMPSGAGRPPPASSQLSKEDPTGELRFERVF